MSGTIYYVSELFDRVSEFEISSSINVIGTSSDDVEDVDAIGSLDYALLLNFLIIL